MIKVIFKLTMVFVFGSTLVYCQPDSKKNDSSKAVTNLLLLSTLSGGGGAPTGVKCYGKDFVKYVGEEINLQCEVSGSRSSLTFSVSPELPAGLQLVNKQFGVGMEGTLTEISKKKDYKLTVKNPSGEVSTFLKGLIFPTPKKGFVYDFYMSSGVPFHKNVYEILR